MNATAIWVGTTTVALALGVACGSPTDGSSSPPTLIPTIRGSELTTGGESRLTGTHLDKLPASVEVDGIMVDPTSRTPTEIRFQMPSARMCEIDGRAVPIRAGTLTHTGRLAVPGTVDLRVGESRAIAVTPAGGPCLQFPAGGERYVLTILNPSLDPAPAPDALLTVRAWTGSGASTGRSNSRIAADRASPIELPRSQGTLAASSRHAYIDNPAPFDPRYATAAVGDTLPWLDWWGNTLPNCTESRDRQPTIQIVVAAISASGKTVIAFDTRSLHGTEWASSAARARLLRVAEMMDRWALPAVRESMDRGFTPVRGAGGRWFHVFRPDVAGWSVDNNDAPQTACRYSSEVVSTVGPDVPPQNDAQSEYLAGLAIHEFGHHAEIVYRLRRWGSAMPPMRVSTRWGGLGEAWAQTVQETAARLASNQPTNASYTLLDVPGSGVPYADFYLNGYGESPVQSMWRTTTGGSRPGYYDHGTRFLMYLREKWGDAHIGNERERFFHRVQELPHYDVQSLAGLVSLTATSALDRWSVAEATDNLVDPAAALAEDLPQIHSWDPHDRAPLPSLTVSRTADSAWPVNVGRGNYAALYLFADGEHAGKGLSLTFEAVSTSPSIVRITRVR